MNTIYGREGEEIQIGDTVRGQVAFDGNNYAPTTFDRATVKQIGADWGRHTSP